MRSDHGRTTGVTLATRRVTMRVFLALSLFATACAAVSSGGGTNYDSVRDRLDDRPTRLYMGGEGSSGSITARRWVQGAWSEGTTPVTIDRGEASVKVDSHGAL